MKLNKFLISFNPEILKLSIGIWAFKTQSALHTTWRFHVWNLDAYMNAAGAGGAAVANHHEFAGVAWRKWRRGWNQLAAGEGKAMERVGVSRAPGNQS